MFRTKAGMLLTAALIFANLLVAQPARAADKTVAKLVLTVGAKPIDVWLTRADTEDGGLTIKVIAKGVGPRPQAITLYTGGGEDDGPGGGEIKSLTLKPFDVPAAGKLVRVDFSYQIPGHTDEQTDTTIIGFQGKTKKLLELTTKRTRTRNKHCKEVEENALTAEGDDLDGYLVTNRRLKVIPVRGDDDEPLDPGCVSQKPEKKQLRWNGERFVDPQPQPTPSPAPQGAAMAKPAPKQAPAAAESED
jgi:hypothetical protein